MKFYLSSYKIGSKGEDLIRLTKGKKIGVVVNAIDHAETSIREEKYRTSVELLTDLGIDAQLLDLQKYFGKQEELRQKIASLGGVWVRGGNTFVLRQAMRLSGFDEIINEEQRDDFFYGGYSAGICILAPSLKGLDIVDDSSVVVYKGAEVIWEGLGLLDYLILPHYKSDHSEAVDIDKEVEYCKENNIEFTPLRDGDVIIIE